VAVRALRMRGQAPVAGTGAGALYAAAARRLDGDLSDRPMGDDIESARALLWERRGAG
jgi:hypothetical protein